MDPHRTHISKELFDHAEERGVFVDPVLAEAHWHMGQVENHARCHLQANNYRYDVVQIYLFELIKSVKTVIKCGFYFFELIKTVMEESLAGHFF